MELIILGLVLMFIGRRGRGGSMDINWGEETDSEDDSLKMTAMPVPIPVRVRSNSDAIISRRINYF